MASRDVDVTERRSDDRDATRGAAGPGATAHFGGPDRPRYLRDLLEQRVELAPPGGRIDWVTYYFRDRALAEALIRAHRRGVEVAVTLERSPRLRDANDAVVAMLSDPASGIGAGLRVVRRGLFRHLHEKLYCFSHPRPVAFVGSFNPSGDRPDDPVVIDAIGDQDRGHNCLVELGGGAATALSDHARLMHGWRLPAGRRFSNALNCEAGDDDTDIYFFPRRSDVLGGLLAGLGATPRLRIAVSHLRDGRAAATLARLASAGAGITLITEATRRRVPPGIEHRLTASGIGFARYHHPDALPMHSKFLLAEGPAGRWVAFGSFNLTRTSRWLNHEILAVSRDPQLFDAFADRWEEMTAEMRANRATGAP